MAFKRKTDTGSGDQFKFENVGQSLTGYYLGSFPHEGEYGPTKKHVFKSAKGIKVVFGQTHLTGLLEGEEVGVLMKVTYDGDKKMRKGNPLKMYTLDIDSEQRLDANEIPSSEESSEGYDEDDNTSLPVDDEPEAEDNEEEQALDEVKTAPAKNLRAPGKSPSAESRSRVDQLLSKNRRAS